MNRFAHMAVEAHDRNAAQQVFAMIGNDWDHTVWKSSLDFDNARLWAEGQEGGHLTSTPLLREPR
jgi:hypothetical protein